MAADPLAALDDARTISSDWLTDANHYRMQLLGDAADNPDQRIAEDIKLFVERSARRSASACSSAIVTLVSFVVILWGLSAAAPLHLFGVDLDRSRAIWSGRR